MKFSSKLVWWYWAITTFLLVGVLAGYNECLQAVIALNIVQVVHFIYREKSVTAFPVQVRVVYFVRHFPGWFFQDYQRQKDIQNGTTASSF